VKFQHRAVQLLLLILTGCQFYSPAKAPEENSSDSYLTKFYNPKQGSLKTFFEEFKDPELLHMVHLALTQNKDLLIAVEKIEETKALYGVAKSNLFPKLGFDAGAFRFHSGSTTPLGAFERGMTVNNNLFLQSFTLSWEIDLFGKVRNQKLAAAHNILRTEAAQKGVLVSLSAEVALTYFEMSYYMEAIELYKKTLAAQEKLIELGTSRVNAGIEAHQSLDSIKKFYYALAKTLPDLDAGLKKARHHLAILVGCEPSELKFDPKKIKPIQSHDLFFHVLLPAELLLNRPDVIEARQQFLSSSYGVKSAKADLFPRFSLLGAFGTFSENANQWLQKSSSLWTIGPMMRWPLFEGFNVLSNIQVEKSKQNQALLQYQSTVLKALEEVENALVTVFQQQERQKDARLELEAQRAILTSATSLHKSGIKGLDQEKTQERETFEEESRFLEAKFSSVKSLILLYKSLGGNWR